MANIQDNPAFQQGVSAEAGDVEVIAFSAGVLPVEQQTAVRLERQSGSEIDPAEDATLQDILTAVQGTVDVDTGTVRVQDDTPLDVSASALDVSAAVVSVQEDSPLDVSAAPIDASAATVSVQEDTPLDVSAVPLDVSAATVTVQEDTALDVSGATVTVTQSGPVSLSTVTGSTVTDTTTATGAANAATITVPDGREQLEIYIDTTGSATVTLETSPDGTSFFTRETFSIPSAVTSARTRRTGAETVRVFADQNLTELTIQAKGV